MSSHFAFMAISNSSCLFLTLSMILREREWGADRQAGRQTELEASCKVFKETLKRRVVMMELELEIFNDWKSGLQIWLRRRVHPRFQCNSNPIEVCSWRSCPCIFLRAHHSLNMWLEWFTLGLYDTNSPGHQSSQTLIFIKPFISL